MSTPNYLRKVSTSLVLATLATIPSLALAGGMTIGDLGARAEGRAGAFAAKADDLTAIEYNPAGLTLIQGTSFYLSNRFGHAYESFHRAATPERDLDEDGVRTGALYEFDAVENGTPWQLLNPVIAAGSNFGLENWAFAIGAYAPPGIASQKFPEDGGQRYMLIERDVKILYYNLSAAWKYKDLFGIGASVQWVDAASIKMSLVVDGNNLPGRINPVSSSADFKTTLEGADHLAASGLLGVWYHPFPYLQFGLSGRVAPTNLEAKCKLTAEPITLTGGEVETLRNGQPADDVYLAMTLPPMARFGARYLYLDGTRPVFDVELDFVFEAWSMTDRYTIDGVGLVTRFDNDPTKDITINKIHLLKNWRNTYSVRLGGDYHVIPELFTLRLGTLYESAATQPEYAYMDFFSSHRIGAGVGASVEFRGVDIALSYNFIYEFPISVTEAEGQINTQRPGTPCQPPYTDDDNCDLDFAGQVGATVNGGDYESRYHFATLSASYTF